MDKILFSHKSDDYATPDWLYWWFVDHCGFYDPCPLFADFDGLEVEWPKNKSVFINPPFSKILPFVEKGIKHYCACDILSPRVSVCFLLPVRTDTKWFRRLYEFGCKIEFFPYRLRFSGSKGNAPFPCMLVHLDNRCGPYDGGGVFNVDDFDRLKVWYAESKELIK